MLSHALDYIKLKHRPHIIWCKGGVTSITMTESFFFCVLSTQIFFENFTILPEVRFTAQLNILLWALLSWKHRVNTYMARVVFLLHYSLIIFFTTQWGEIFAYFVSLQKSFLTFGNNFLISPKIQKLLFFFFLPILHILPLRI